RRCAHEFDESAAGTRHSLAQLDAPSWRVRRSADGVPGGTNTLLRCDLAGPAGAVWQGRLLHTAVRLSRFLMDIFARIDRWGHDAPHRSAHISGARQLTYHELIHRSNALAAYLARALPGDGTPVAVVGHKEPEMLIAFLGAVKSGHPYIPLDTTLPAQRINQIISSSEAGLTLTPQRIMALSDDFAPAPRRHPDTA